MTSELSLWELQARLIYSVLTAGKSAQFAEKKTLALIGDRVDEMPFSIIQEHIEDGDIEHWLRSERTGAYSRLLKCFPALIALDPLNCTVQQLQSVHGIGPKTSRFFIMWTRPGAQHAALDTHILKWLRSLGYDAPIATPQEGSRYEALEQVFLDEARRRGKEPRELDYEIWDSYANNRAQLPLAIDQG